MFYLTPPRHISTLPFASVCPQMVDVRSTTYPTDIVRSARQIGFVPLPNSPQCHCASSSFCRTVSPR